MEDAIHRAEAVVESLRTKVTLPEILADHVKTKEAYEQLADAQHEVECLYARWAELDAKG